MTPSRQHPSARHSRRRPGPGRVPLVVTGAGLAAVALAAHGLLQGPATPAVAGLGGAAPAAALQQAAGHQHTGHPAGGATAAAMPAMPAMPSMGAVRMPRDKESLTEMARVLALVPASAATAVAVRNGAWTDPATWRGGTVPTAGAKVLVPARVAVTYATTAAPAVATVRVDGTLAFDPARRSRLVVDTIVVTHTGTLQIGTPVAPVTAGVDVVFAGAGPVSDPYRFGRGLVSMGRAVITGRTTTAFLPLAGQPGRGARTLQLSAAPVGWAKGDAVVVSGTHWRGDGPRQDEKRTVTSVSGTALTLDRPLRFDHRTNVVGAGPYVADLARTVRFSSDRRQVAERGHVMFMHSAAVAVHGAAFVDLGRTDKNRLADTLGVKISSNGFSTPGKGTNPLGRYALHFHRAGVAAGSAPVDVSDDVVAGSPGWGLVNHSSNVVARDDVVWDVRGAAYVSEVGNEIGAFDHDIAIGSDGIGPKSERQNMQGPHVDTVLHDMWADGFGFGMRSAKVALTRDVATDQALDGFAWNGWDAEKYLVPAPGGAVSPDQVPVATFRGNVAVADRVGVHFDAVAADNVGKYSVVDGLTVADSGDEGIRIRYAAVVLRDVTVVNRTKGARLGIELGPNGSGSRVESDFSLLDVVVHGFDVGVDNAGAQHTGDAVRPADVFVHHADLAGNGKAWSVPDTTYLHMVGGTPGTGVTGVVTPGDGVMRPGGFVRLTLAGRDAYGTQPARGWFIPDTVVKPLIAKGYRGTASKAYVEVPLPVQSRVTGRVVLFPVRVPVNLADWPGHGGPLGG